MSSRRAQRRRCEAAKRSGRHRKAAAIDGRKSMKDKKAKQRSFNFASLPAPSRPPPPSDSAPRLLLYRLPTPHHQHLSCRGAGDDKRAREGQGERERGEKKKANNRGKRRRRRRATPMTTEAATGRWPWPSALALPKTPNRTTKQKQSTHLVLSTGLLLEQVLAPGVAPRGRTAGADLDLGDAPCEECAERDGDQGHDGRERGGEAVVHDRVGHPVRVAGVVAVRRTLEQKSCVHRSVISTREHSIFRFFFRSGSRPRPRDASPSLFFFFFEGTPRSTSKDTRDTRPTTLKGTYEEDILFFTF